MNKSLDKVPTHALLSPACPSFSLPLLPFLLLIHFLSLQSKLSEHCCFTSLSQIQYHLFRRQNLSERTDCCHLYQVVRLLVSTAAVYRFLSGNKKCYAYIKFESTMFTKAFSFATDFFEDAIIWIITLSCLDSFTQRIETFCLGDLKHSQARLRDWCYLFSFLLDPLCDHSAMDWLVCPECMSDS